MNPRRWNRVYWALTLAFIVSAVLNLAHLRAGFLTNHLADVVVPAWLYLIARSLYPGGRSTTFIARTIGRTPARTALVLFAASTITEFSQRAWPHGLFPGRFDPYDIVAYAVGLAAVYLVDEYGRVSPLPVVDVSSGSVS